MQQAVRIEKILRQMRSLSVVSSHLTRLKVEPLIHEAINIVADLFAKNKVEVVERFHNLKAEARIDHDELIQVLTNMLRNSLQAVLENDGPTRKVEIQTSSWKMENSLSTSLIMVLVSPKKINPNFLKVSFQLRNPMKERAWLKHQPTICSRL